MSYTNISVKTKRRVLSRLLSISLVSFLILLPVSLISLVSFFVLLPKPFSQVFASEYLVADSKGQLNVVSKNDSYSASLQGQTPYQAIKSLIDSSGQTHCADKITNIARFIGADSPGASSVISYNETQQQQELITAVVSANTLDGSHLATLNFALGESCTGTYEVIKLWQKNCQQTVNATYSTYKNKTVFSSSTALYRASPDLHLYTQTLPGGGCLTVQKQVLW